MQTKVGKLKKNESRAIGSSVGQKRNEKKQSNGFLDKRLIGKNRSILRMHNKDIKHNKTIQLQAFTRNSGGTTGELVSKEQGTLITISGWIQRGMEEKQIIQGSLNFHIDEQDKKRIVIGNIKCTPKRTGAGSVLVYLLAARAVDMGMELVGTDLSALEEGTPEFYMSIGLAPTKKRGDEVSEIVKEMPNITAVQVKNMMYSARLDATPDKVKMLAANKLGTWIPNN